MNSQVGTDKIGCVEGIVGKRDLRSKGGSYWGHTSLNEMNDLLSELHANTYEFTSISNSFDLIASIFHQKIINIEGAVHISKSNSVDDFVNYSPADKEH